MIPCGPFAFLKRCRVLFLLLPILNCLNGDRRLDCKSILPGPKSRFTCHIWDLPLSISPTLLILYIKISTISSSKLSHLSHRLSVCHTSDIPLALSPWPTLCVKSLFVQGFFYFFLVCFFNPFLCIFLTPCLPQVLLHFTKYHWVSFAGSVLMCVQF